MLKCCLMLENCGKSSKLLDNCSLGNFAIYNLYITPNTTRKFNLFLQQFIFGMATK